MRSASREKVAQAFALVGCAPPEVRRDGSRDEREAQLQAWKDDVVQPAFKRRLLELHPDRRPVEEAERANAETAALVAARDVLLSARLPPEPVQQEWAGIPVVVSPGATSFTIFVNGVPQHGFGIPPDGTATGGAWSWRRW